MIDDNWWYLLRVTLSGNTTIVRQYEINNVANRKTNFGGFWSCFHGQGTHYFYSACNMVGSFCVLTYNRLIIHFHSELHRVVNFLWTNHTAYLCRSRGSSTGPSLRVSFYGSTGPAQWRTRWDNGGTGTPSSGRHPAKIATILVLKQLSQERVILLR